MLCWDAALVVSCWRTGAFWCFEEATGWQRVYIGPCVLDLPECNRPGGLHNAGTSQILYKHVSSAVIHRIFFVIATSATQMWKFANFMNRIQFPAVDSWSLLFSIPRNNLISGCTCRFHKVKLAQCVRNERAAHSLLKLMCLYPPSTKRNVCYRIFFLLLGQAVWNNLISSSTAVPLL